MIYILTNYKYPSGDAGSLRMHSFAQAFQRLGVDCKVIGYGTVSDCEQELDGIRYKSLRTPNKYLSYLTLPLRSIAAFSRLRKKEDITHILLANVSVPTLILMKLYCRLNGIKVIYDVVEWYSASQFKNGKRNSKYLWKTFTNSYLIDKSVNVISISTFLHDYYRSKGISSVRIPIFFNQRQDYVITPKDDRTVITYAGQIGKKDFLWLMVKSIASLDADVRNRITFNIIGCSRQQVDNLCSEMSIDADLLAETVKAHGRLPHSEVLAILKKSHFTFLLRDGNERYARAGFPSKVIESISQGVPPIMNLSSDLGLYFENGKNAVIVEDLTLDKIKAALTYAVELTADDYANIARGATSLAQTQFNIHSYLAEFNQLVN